jgi:hypothetical protein
MQIKRFSDIKLEEKSRCFFLVGPYSKVFDTEENDLKELKVTTKTRDLI